MCLRTKAMNSNANITDIKHMVQLSLNNSADSVFAIDPVEYEKNLAFAVLRQHYHIGVESVKVYKDDDKLLAYSWANVGQMPWTKEKMVVVQMVELDLSLSPRTRIEIIKDMMRDWEMFANISNSPIICSQSSRRNQEAFLRLHEKNGYDVRGSIAYKRLF